MLNDLPNLIRSAAIAGLVGLSSFAMGRLSREAPPPAPPSAAPGDYIMLRDFRAGIGLSSDHVPGFVTLDACNTAAVAFIRARMQQGSSGYANCVSTTGEQP